MIIFKKILLILLIIILVIISILFIIGFSSYSKVLKEKPLIDRITEITSKENYVKFDSMSKNYINAVIAIEDHRYYDHGAVDFIALARALFTNIRDKEFDEGGSTITQQVAKNIVFSQDKSWLRKIGEIFAAYDVVEAEKNDVLQAKLDYVLEPTDDEVAQMKAYLAGKYHKDKVELALEKKPELIGGLVLRVGDIEEDYSMKGRLNRLERRLAWR